LSGLTKQLSWRCITREASVRAGDFARRIDVAMVSRYYVQKTWRAILFLRLLSAALNVMRSGTGN
jgi:hypothetical protein